MRKRVPSLFDRTVVITGASSGIGLATARMAAYQGAHVVMIARNAASLDDVAGEIESRGGHALPFAADVADHEQLEAAASAAVERFGPLDTWVNAAGVDVWGRVTDIRAEDNRRLFDTNFWGVVHGSLVAVSHLRSRGGAIINVGSIESDRAFPMQGMYAASKHAVKGFGDALRMELEQEGLPITVTLIKPGSIGTPLPDQAKTYLELSPRLPKPVYRPEEVAHAILSAAVRPKRDIYVGGQARLAASFARHAPRLLDRVSEDSLIEPQMSDESSAGRRDNLHEPGVGGEVVGKNAGRLSRSLYTRAVVRPGTTGAVFAAGAGSLVLGLLALRGRRSA